MNITEAGEARIRGYVFVLERSLRTFLPAAEAMDASREVESHIRDRAAEAEALPDERVALERVIEELGPPLRVARAYSLEMVTEEAVATGRLGAVARALVQIAALGIGGFLATILVFIGYAIGVSFLAVAVLKPIFPNNVGLFLIDGLPRSFGAQFPPPSGATVAGGYWIIPLCVALGVATIVSTHAAARRILRSWLERRADRIPCPARLNF